MRTDGERGLLAVETRDPEKLLLSFWVVNVATGELLLDQYKTPELWWTGLETVAQGKLFFHGYGPEGFGKHQGLTVFNIKTGQTLWTDKNVSFYGLTSDYLLVQPSKIQSGLVGLDADTGQVKQPHITFTDAQAMLTEKAQTEQYFWQPAVQYTAGNPFFSDLSRFVQIKIGQEARLAIDYLEQEHYFVIGFYCRAARDKYTYQVLVFSRAGELWWQTVLAEDLKGIGADAFFILRETLILVKNKNVLLGLRPRV